MRNRFVVRKSAFTLIELLIVVAIIAILAAIAVPNFLEAQTRSKVSRAKADMRSVATAMEAYRVDNNAMPPPAYPYDLSDGREIEWWGFVPSALTTPVSYITTQPAMPFSDVGVLGVWQVIDPGNTRNNQPYTYIYDIFHMAGNGLLQGTMPYNVAAAPDPIPKPFDPADGRTFTDQLERSSYVLYTCGPDGVDSSVWVVPVEYDPTNGTTSFGDVHRFGSGSPDDSGVSDNRL